MATVVSNDIKATGGDYADIAAWEAATDVDIVTADEQHDGLLFDEVYAELVDLVGATTDITRYRRLTSAPGETPTDGTWVAGDGPRLRPTGLAAGEGILRSINEDYARFDHFEVGPNSDANGSGESTGVKVGTLGCHATRMMVHDLNISINNHGIDTAGNMLVVRNLIYDIAGATARGIAGWSNISTTGYMLYNTVHNCQEGIRAAGASAYTTQVKGNLCTGNSGEDYNDVGASTRIADYNVSDDATGDDMGGSNNTINVTPANEYVSLTGGSENFHLKSGATAIGAGVDLVTTPVFVNIDIDGYDVDGGGDAAWDAGCDQFGKALTAPVVSLAGTAAGTTTATGAISVIRGLAGAPAAAATITGALGVTRGLVVGLAGDTTLTGAVVVARGLAGTAAGATTASGALAVTRGLAGAPSADATLTGALSATRRLAGTLAAAATLVGALAVTRGLASSAAADATLTGGLTVGAAIVQLAGTAAGDTTASGALTVVRGLAGTPAGDTTLTGALSATRGLAGTAAADATLAGALGVTRSLAATAAADATLTGALAVVRALAGEANGSTTATGALSATRGLAGAPSADTTASGALSVIRRLAGALAGDTTVSGNILVVRFLAGQASGTTTLVGVLIGGTFPVRVVDVSTVLYTVVGSSRPSYAVTDTSKTLYTVTEG